MTSFQKINEAKFFLELIDQYYQDDEKCEYCLSAFLHATYDLIDHTFEEYRQHFHVKIPDNEQRRLTKFVEIAKEKPDGDASGFIKLYITELQKIYTNPVCASMLIIRNTNTHEQTNLTPFSTFTEYPDGRRDFDTRYFLASHDLALPFFRNDLKGYVCDKSKKMHNYGKMLGINLPITSLSDLNNIYNQACDILSETDVKEVCKMYFKLLEGFVTEIRAKYPRW